MSSEVYTVSMCPTEMRMGNAAATDRQLNAITKGLADKHGFEKGTKGPWQGHIEGVLAEMAVASVLGCYFNGSITSWKGEDLPHLQIRQTDYPHGKLIIRPEDGENFYYVLVTGCNGKYNVRGWVWGRSVKESQTHWEEPKPGDKRPGYWGVPQSALNDMEELKLRLMDIIP